MKKAFIALLCGAVLAIPPQVGKASSLSANKCPPSSKNYCHSSTTVSVPSSGTFQVTLAGTKVTLKGIASSSTFRALIFMQKVTMRNVPRHGQAFKVFATKRIPALRMVSKGKLYRYIQATGHWQGTGAITGAGIYAAVLR